MRVIGKRAPQVVSILSNEKLIQNVVASELNRFTVLNKRLESIIMHFFRDDWAHTIYPPKIDTQSMRQCPSDSEKTVQIKKIAMELAGATISGLYPRGDAGEGGFPRSGSVVQFDMPDLQEPISIKYIESCQESKGKIVRSVKTKENAESLKLGEASIKSAIVSPIFIDQGLKAIIAIIVLLSEKGFFKDDQSKLYQQITAEITRQLKDNQGFTYQVLVPKEPDQKYRFDLI